MSEEIVNRMDLAPFIKRPSRSAFIEKAVERYLDDMNIGESFRQLRNEPETEEEIPDSCEFDQYSPDFPDIKLKIDLPDEKPNNSGQL